MKNNLFLEVFIKKGIYIDENKDVEIVSFDKPTEYVCGTKNKLTDLLSIYSEDEGSKIEINNELFSLPVLIVPKSKMTDYDIESFVGYKIVPDWGARQTTFPLPFSLT